MVEQEKEVFTTDVITRKVKVGLSNGRGTLLLAIVGTIVSFCATFMVCIFSIGFNLSQLGNSVFWSRWASMAVSTMCVYLLVILHKDEMNRLKPWYVEKYEEFQQKAQSAIGEKFEEYLREININRRIEWYKRKINGKIAKMNQKQLRLETRRKIPGIKKRIEQIKEQIEKLKEKIDEEYIEANKENLKTRSKPICSVQILSETQRGDSGEQNFRSASSYYGGKSLSKIILSLVMTAAFACVTLNDLETGFTVASVVVIIFTVFSMVTSIVFAVLAANGCYKNVYVPNLLFKLKILADYETWKANK